MEEDAPDAVHKFCVRFKTSETAAEFEKVFLANKGSETGTALEPVEEKTVPVNKPVQAPLAIPKPVLQAKPSLAPGSIQPKAVQNLAPIFAKKPEEVAKPVEEAPKEEPKKNLFGGLASAMKTSGFGQPATSPFSFSFGSKPTEEKPEEKSTGFGFGKSADEPAKPGLGFNFGKTEETAPKPSGFNFGATSKPSEGFKGLGATAGSSTFGSLASQGNNAFQGNSGFNFSNKGKPLFGAGATEKADENDAENGESENDPYFEPVIDLPDLVKVKTGEEGLEEIFKSRAKVFRWDNEWKERGLGECKIYRDPETGKGRCLLRREQVHKLAMNHFIDPRVTLAPTNGSDKSWTWAAMDFADEEAKLEKFAIRFKTAELAKEFETAFYSFREGSTGTSVEPVPEPVIEQNQPAARSEPVTEKPKPKFGFGIQPPENEDPAAMAMRLQAEKLAADVEKAATRQDEKYFGNHFCDFIIRTIRFRLFIYFFNTGFLP